MACGGLDVDIFEYEGYIAGLVSSYLSGTKIDPANVQSGDGIRSRLRQCEEKLRELTVYMELLDELSHLLVANLKNDTIAVDRDR